MATSWVCALYYAIDGPAAVGSGLPDCLLACLACLPACPVSLPGWVYYNITTAHYYYSHDRFCTFKLRLCAP